MRTAKYVKKKRTHGSFMSIPGSNQSTCTSGNESESVAGSSNRSSMYFSDGESIVSEEYVADVDSVYE